MPDTVVDLKFTPQQFVRPANDHTIICCIEFDDIKRARLASEIQTLALANGKIMDPVVVTKNPCFLRHNLPLRISHLRALPQKFTIIIFRYETNFLALLFAISLEPDLFRNSAGLLLGHFADGKHRAGQLVLVERKQKIRLVFAVVTGRGGVRSGYSG